MSDSPAPYTSWPKLMEALLLNSGGPTGGSLGQVLISDGTGAPIWSTVLTLSIPDNTVYGGNQRGVDAIDFQLNRSDPTQVTSGNCSVIVGGSSNINSDSFSFIGGGLQNSSTGGNYNFIGAGNTNIVISTDYGVLIGGTGNYLYYSDYSFLGGGSGNEIDYSFAVIVGGQYNYAESYSAVINGYSNEAVGQYSFVGNGTENQSIQQFSHIDNGEQNQSTGQYSFVGNGQQNLAATTSSTVLNGTSNTAQGTSSLVLNGTSNVAQGPNSSVLNGNGCSTSGIYSTIINGQNASDKDRIGWTGYSTGTFGGPSGDQQAGLTILSATASYQNGTSPITLTAGNTSTSTNAPTSNNIINLSQLSVLHIRGTVLGLDTTTFDAGAWTVDFVIKQAYGSSSTAIVGTPSIIPVATDTTFAAIVVSVAADTTNGGVALTVANPASWNNVTYWQANLIVTEIVVPFS